MKILGEINGKQIIYIQHDLATVWFNDLPKSNWLLFSISDEKQVQIFYEIARRCIDNNVVYVCAAGREGELFHDCFDEILVIRDVEKEYLPKHDIMTTWHNNFDEGFWFASTVANDDEIEINKIICLNITRADNSTKLSDLIEKINSGWLPPY